MVQVYNPSALNIGRNLFRNPNFAVILASASGTIPDSLAVPTLSLGELGETGWILAASGGTPAYAFSSINENLTITGASGVTAVYLAQRLESKNTNRIKSKTATFSVKLSNSLLTSVTWEVFRPTTTADTHGTIASPTQTLIASGTFTVSSTAAKYSATFTLPTEANLGLEFRLRVGAQTSGTLIISELKLEEGNVATDFNCDDVATELSKCKRHYESGTHRLSQYNLSGFLWEIDIPLVEKFATPSIFTANETFGGFAGLTNISVSNKKFTYTTDASANTGQHVIQFDWQSISHIP